MIKLLALDLDGTLLDSRGKIPDANKQAIRRAEQAGVLVTICTGRRFRDALPVALELELNAPIITHNGALLKFADSLEIVAVSILSNETIREILGTGKEFGVDAMLSADPHGKGTLYYDRISAENVPLQKYIAWSRTLHGDEAEDAIHHVDDLREVLETTETVHVSFSGRCAPMRELQTVLAQRLATRANILTTVYERLDFTLIDILPPDASKGFGMEKLAAVNGFSRRELMAIGDNFNDLEMLEAAGCPVVMGNAAPGLADGEKYHETLSNDENGVAAAIEKFILKAV